MKPFKKPTRKIFILYNFIVFCLVGILWVNTREHRIQSDLSEKSDLLRFAPLNLNPEYRELLDLQAAFIRNARKLKPAVVSINNLTKIKESPHASIGVYPNSRLFIFQFKEWLIDKLERRYMIESLGSGLIWDSFGHIVTNYHLIQDAESFFIQLSGGKEFRTKLIGADSMTDLAVLKVFSWGDFPTVPIGQTSDLKIGEWVMAIGNPYGLERTVTVGVISSKKGIRPNGWDYLRYIQTDNSINPGNGGGPLINLNGEIIGINTVSDNFSPGLGLTLPIETAYKVISQLIENGKMDWGWLGISIQSLTPELAASFNLSSSQIGVLINAIEMEAPASVGGLKQGDIVIQYDHHPVTGSRMLQDQVVHTEIGRKVPIKIIRNGSLITLFIEIGKIDSEHYGFRADQDPLRLI